MTDVSSTSRSNLPSIDGIFIDAGALTRIAHDCRPDACPHSDGGCCGYYDVYVHPDELDGLVGMMPPASAYAPHLHDDNGFINVFEEDGDELVIDKTDDGRCVFGYADAHARHWCALHRAALDRGIPLIQAKPTACLLWPLALTETGPPVLSVQDGAIDFACNRERNGTPESLDAGIADIVCTVFGVPFHDQLRRILAGAAQD